MRTIHKFPLRLEARQTVMMDAAGRVLHVGVQHEQICLWAEVDDQRPAQARTVAIHGTGRNMGDEADPIRHHLGTVQIGEFVWHVYGDRPR